MITFCPGSRASPWRSSSVTNRDIDVQWSSLYGEIASLLGQREPESRSHTYRAIGRLLARLLPVPLKAAHFTLRHREVDGLIFPTFRRVMLALPGHRPVPGLTMICAQLSDISVSFADDAAYSAKLRTVAREGESPDPTGGTR